ncbi:hypothetical protein ACW5R3_10175 [Bizionia sp. KMM 8389]
MKKRLLTLALCAVTLVAKSQDATVEKSIFGIQTGFLGLWAYNELGLSNSIALRSEIGIDVGLTFNSNYHNKTIVMTAPVITLEPRWYYNLKKRERKSRRTDGNTGNYIAIKTSYHPDLLISVNYDNVKLVSDLTIIPTWGIRRTIGQHFNYETGIGIGYIHAFNKDNQPLIDDPDVAVNVHLRIGYKL